MPPRARKNSAADRAFIGAALRAGELRIDPDLELLVWSGTAEDIGHPFQVPPDGQRCTKTRPVLDSDGGRVLGADLKPLLIQCHHWKVDGGPLCVLHLGGMTAMQAAVKEQIATVAPRLAARLIAVAMSEKTGDKEVISSVNSLLDRIGVRGGLDISTDLAPWQKMLQQITGGGVPDGPDAGAEEG